VQSSTAIVDPKRAICLIENALPKDVKSYMERRDPTREQALNDIVDPIDKKSNTESVEPMR
jgi:hypothetical protein